MSYQVIARRWRPQKFDEVVFQNHVSSTIRNSIASERISHAYIFTGPRGVGKTTTARILAKSLNCIHGPTPDPCGVCENCVEITEGNSFDVIEIDGASNNSVDNIRDLREKVNFAPVKSKYKVYIIDEVHMLSTGAFNALLKTLEEPPPHVIFIFATTEIHKVPDTILSRCQKYFFKKIDPEYIVSHLKKIIDKDGFNVKEKALYAVARAAGGSMRDAQSLLEQVLSFAEGDETSEEAALAVLGVVPIDSYVRILKAIASKDAELIIKEAASIVETGADIPRYAAGMLEIVRTVRFITKDIDIKNITGYSNEEILLLKEVGGQFADDELSGFFKILNSLQNDLKYSDNERIHLEMALLDMLAVAEKPSIADIIKAVKSTTVNSEKKNSLNRNVTQKNTNKVTTNFVKNSIEETKNITVNEHKNNDNSSNIKEEWSNFINNIKSLKPLLFQKIIKCKIEFGERRINIVLPQKNMGRIKINFDDDDRNFIFSEFKKLTSERFEIIYNSPEGNIVNTDDTAPLPEKQMIEDIVHNEVENSNVVKKLVDTFFGEVLDYKKGE